MRLVAALALVAPVAFAAIVVWSPPVAAQAALEVVAGMGGFRAAGDHVPVQVTVSSDRLLLGTLRATTAAARVTVAQEIEVPGVG